MSTTQEEILEKINRILVDDDPPQIQGSTSCKAAFYSRRYRRDGADHLRKVDRPGSLRGVDRITTSTNPPSAATSRHESAERGPGATTKDVVSLGTTATMPFAKPHCGQPATAAGPLGPVTNWPNSAPRPRTTNLGADPDTATSTTKTDQEGSIPAPAVIRGTRTSGNGASEARRYPVLAPALEVPFGPHLPPSI